jgi:hypothetical protein
VVEPASTTVKRFGLSPVCPRDVRSRLRRLPISVRSGAHDGAVPRISFFYGIVVTMYFYDHDPPHFHAEYAKHHAATAIGSNDVLVGSLPSRALKLVTEWASLHREELEADWQRTKDGGSPEPIDPLP